MPLVSVDDLQAVARKAAPLYHDEYSERALVQRLEEYVPRRRGAIARFELSVSGVRYPSVYAAIKDESANFGAAELTVVEPPEAGPMWEYLRPFRSIMFHPDGSADLFPLEPTGQPKRAIVRVVMRENYVPRSLMQDREAANGAVVHRPETELASLSDSIKFVRTTGVLPFGVALFLYMSEERVTIELDLLDDLVLKDARAGRLPASRRVRRPSRVAFGVDQFIARGELSVLSARALEALVETHGLTTVELSHTLGGPRELGKSALESLVARRFASFDKRTGLYRPRLEAFLSAADRVQPRDDLLPPLPNPALRTSVQELIDAADARATCPLCGDAMPPGPRGMLCARCQAEVGATS
ncbi:MAG: hypothetical protein L3J96_01605 [Thermoplasmata archaeon]|nr:hypothetical protein [Thermoplasmata archaeon]